jgi:ribosomal protein L37AE/L43A
MSLSLRSRVRRIERVAHDHDTGHPCPACGHTPGMAVQRMALCMHDDCGPERCPECGRRRVLHLTFDELDP